MSALPGRAQSSHQLPILETDLAWQKRARCAGMDPELFYPSKGRSGNRQGRSTIPAARICGRCEVQLECLQYALTHPDGYHGVWGGATEEERKQLRKGRVA